MPSRGWQKCNNRLSQSAYGNRRQYVSELYLAFKRNVSNHLMPYDDLKGWSLSLNGPLVAIATLKLHWCQFLLCFFGFKIATAALFCFVFCSAPEMTQNLSSSISHISSPAIRSDIYFIQTCKLGELQAHLTQLNILHPWCRSTPQNNESSLPWRQICGTSMKHLYRERKTTCGWAWAKKRSQC